MNQYIIGEEGIKKFRRRYFNILLPIVAGGAAIYLAINLMSTHASDGPTPFIITAAVLAYFGFTMTRLFNKQKKVLRSYRLTITDNEIVREQLNTPPLTINFMEVKEIMKTKKGSFIVRGVSRTDLIQIPYWVDDVASLENELQKFSPITTANTYIRKQYGVLVLRVLALALLIVTSTVDNKIVVSICATALIALIAWGLNEIRLNKNISVNSKRRSFVVYTLIAFVVLVNLLSKLWLFPG
ncbi:MAG: hypothetical protein JST42_22150 [Bacteroidetes bacterium]|nr:hypothetical protein [Bacteroidota bacterium]